MIPLLLATFRASFEAGPYAEPGGSSACLLNLPLCWPNICARELLTQRGALERVLGEQPRLRDGSNGPPL